MASTNQCESEIDDNNKIRLILKQLSEHPPEKLESEHLEIKGWCKNAKQFFEKMSESCSCLANGNGGVVLLGVAEETQADKRFSKCPYSDLDAGLLALKLCELTHPPVKNRAYDATEILKEFILLKDVNVFALMIPKSSSINGHMTTKGISKVRVGKECRPNS